MSLQIFFLLQILKRIYFTSNFKTYTSLYDYNLNIYAGKTETGDNYL